MGFFNGGTTISLTLSGQINLINGWATLADGSLAGPVTTIGAEYVNIGATSYPTVYGGDGNNLYLGGGANYDTGLGGTAGFGDVGATTRAPGIAPPSPVLARPSGRLIVGRKEAVLGISTAWFAGKGFATWSLMRLWMSLRWWLGCGNNHTRCFRLLAMLGLLAHDASAIA